MRKAILPVANLAQLALSTAALAAEAIAYNYDTKGQLLRVVHSGSVNNGFTTKYPLDKADNRSNVKTTGATI